ncbi:MAG: efflux RND transporter periplasmic adaptor subunit [Anaerolineae bacterium]|nr:efflux RND transporter periplasmic adaptor subunit [Anaerolineae bacterium]
MQARKKSRQITILIISALITTAFVIGGCQAIRQARAASAPNAGDTVTAFIGDLDSTASASGQLQPSQEAQLALGTSGVVKRVYVRVGDTVRAGDVLIELESDDLQRAVENARQTLAIRGANLAELLKPPSEQDLASAKAAVDNAQAQLNDLLAGPTEDELAKTKAALATAQARLDDLLAGPSKEELAQAQAAIASAKAGLEAARARVVALADQILIAENDIHAAQLGIDQAQKMYDLLVWNDWKAGVSWAPYSPQGTGLKKAQIRYDVAVANLTLTQIDANDLAVRSAESQLAQAQASLAALTEKNVTQIAAAEAQVAQARANLASLVAGNPVQIASARSQLAQAQANLVRLLDGASEEQIATAQAQIEQARISLEDAQASLADATLIAPFDGTVTEVHITIGERAAGPAVDLINTSSLEVVLDVDEIDIGGIAVGQSAIVTLETWPDQDLPGKVVSIAPKAQNAAGIVTFKVHLSFDAGNLPIRVGMTANAELITAQRKNVLLVPNRAITVDRQVNKYYVNLVRGEKTEQVEVIIGLRDNSYTEILDGLQEGDQVYIGEVNTGLDFRNGPPEGIRGMGQ